GSAVGGVVGVVSVRGDHGVAPGVDLVALLDALRICVQTADPGDHGRAAGMGGAVVGELITGRGRRGRGLVDGDGSGVAAAGVVGVASVGGDHGVGAGVDLVAGVGQHGAAGDHASAAD